MRRWVRVRFFPPTPEITERRSRREAEGGRMREREGEGGKEREGGRERACALTAVSFCPAGHCGHQVLVHPLMSTLAAPGVGVRETAPP